MPEPILLRRRLPPHLAPPPARAPETNDARHARQLDLTRELTELNMIAARQAANRIAARDCDPVPGETPGETPGQTPADETQTQAADNPTLALVRATRAVAMVINLENRIAAGEVAPPAAVDDPRGVALRQLLHPLLGREPDPTRRRALKTRINDRIDDALGADLDDELSLGSIAVVIAKEHNLPLTLATIPDVYLKRPFLPPNPPPTGYPRPQANTHDNRWNSPPTS